MSLLLLIPPANASATFLAPLGSVAEAQRSHLIWVIVLTLGAIVPVLIATPLILWRYRYQNKKAKYLPSWAFSIKLEYVLWGLPSIIVTALAFKLWHSVAELAPYRPIESQENVAPLCVQVVGLNWKWLFIYPQYNIATVNALNLPVGRPVSLQLTTDTVMQSFRISALAGQIYAMPGMTTQLNFIASKKGETLGENTQYNGDKFAEQRFAVKALSTADFQQWVSQVKDTGNQLTAENYHILAKPGNAALARKQLDLKNNEALNFNALPAHLFHRIVNRYHTHSAVPDTAQPGSPTYEAERASLPSLDLPMTNFCTQMKKELQ
ncbi:cytochrome ubiquinol oxidase subunit II [Alteromonas pelagimontana]|uniref:Cytochrome ubiquinol oxidase subunit II n=1 Tax=Alteromonas pelagimontana TaxID=1858656 RepID=A0A6M4MH13_9ALTE|nr:ubiquinol oxidase subunit II [Alteromonas pelagimontana]QJR82363.1 cytochrome ubiquinol oxidase subunit II [Alteromonas pelagimontana]